MGHPGDAIRGVDADLPTAFLQRATSARATSSEFDLVSTVPCLLRADSTRR